MICKQRKTEDQTQPVSQEDEYEGNRGLKEILWQHQGVEEVALFYGILLGRFDFIKLHDMDGRQEYEGDVDDYADDVANTV